MYVCSNSRCTALLICCIDLAQLAALSGVAEVQAASATQSFGYRACQGSAVAVQCSGKQSSRWACKASKPPAWLCSATGLQSWMVMVDATKLRMQAMPQREVPDTGCKIT